MVYKEYRISVIIATYNTAQYIEECLYTVIAQTLRPIEVIVVDDGSTDETEDILKEYQDRYSYIKVIYQNNSGQGVAINRALKLVKGEYIAFMDPDDKYPNNECLERLYRAAKRNRALMCGGNILLNDYADGTIKNGYMAGDGDDNHSKNCFIDIRDYYYLYGHTRYIYSSSMMKEHNIKHGVYRRYGDQILTLGAMIASGNIYELDYPVYEYRINHYPEIYNEHTWLDIFKAYKDAISFMIDHGMKKMYEKNAYTVHKPWMAKIFNWISKNKEWTDIIDDIQNVMIESGWSDEDELIHSTLNKVEAETERVDGLFGLGLPILLYGAGRNTKKFIEKYKNRMSQIEGIVVTTNNKSNVIAGIMVDSISDYLDRKNEVLVVVTPEGQAGTEMYNNAYRLGYKYIEKINMQLVAL